MVGDAYARAGHAEQAQKIAAMIEPLEDKNNSEQAGRVDLLKGDIASLAGQHDAAIALFHSSGQGQHTGYTIEAVARGYQQAGDLDRAIPAYEFLLGRRSGGWVGSRSSDGWRRVIRWRWIMPRGAISRRRGRRWRRC